MLRKTVVVLVIAILIGALIPVESLGYSEWLTRPGTVEYTLSLPDLEQVTLDGMMVDRVIGNFVFVRDPWAGSKLLPVFTDAQVEPWWTVEIQGYTQTIAGTRIVVAQQLRLYVDAQGRDIPPLPLKWSLEPVDWPYMTVVTLTPVSSRDSFIPAPPDPASIPYEPSEPISAPMGTVAAAKIDASDSQASVQSVPGTVSVASTPPHYTTGPIELKGKVVSASFPGFFYIEEEDRSCGIKIVPDPPVQVEAGELVDIEGEVIPSSSSVAECYVSASSITHSGWADVPGSLGIPQRMLVGGEFGQQQALYRDTTSTPALVGSGLNTVGLRVKAWGLQTSSGEDNGNDFVYLNDGSGLKPTSSAMGLKVVSWEDCTLPTTQGTNYYSADGILGAEIGANSLPVPVLRVPCPHLSVNITTPLGNELNVASEATSVVIAGLAAAPGTGVASVQVKIDSGTYQDVDNYDNNTHTWTYTWTGSWQSQSTSTIYARVIDSQGNTLETAPRQVTVYPVPVVYVRVSGSGDQSGSSWDNATPTIAAGITAASSQGKQVWVAAGTYYERITLVNNVALYGGFNAVQTQGQFQTAREQRAYRANTVTIDACRQGSVVTAPSGVTSSARLDGFTICNGSSTIGGGIYCSGGSPVIANNYIVDNSAGTGTSSYGGGIYCSSSSAQILNNVIMSNSARRGGGICCSTSVSITISGNIIKGNTAISTADAGGGIHCYSSSAIIVNNVISGNIASGSGSTGGGIFTGASCNITNNTITGNSSTSGGGILCSSSANVSNNIVAFNSSGMCMSGSYTPILRNNCVYGNTSYNYSSGLTPGTGDIQVDPLLVKWDRGDFHIQPQASPSCVDGGWDSAPGLPAIDLDGQLRLQGAHVDIGADESDGTVWSTEPVVVRVSTLGNDVNDGSSWLRAKKSVQCAIDSAAVLGGEVWVAAGTYNERVNLWNGVYVYGGFAGSESIKSERDWRTNISILDCNNLNSCVVTMSGVTACGIDGLTIRNGNGSEGGGVCCRKSSSVIKNTVIKQNQASNHGNILGRGAGIFCDNSTPVITNSWIQDNVAADSGGGIYLSYSPARVLNCAVIANTATNTGGIYSNYSSCEITNATIAYNSNIGVNLIYSNATISNSIVAQNTSTGIRVISSPSLLLQYNDVWGQTSNYNNIADQTNINHNISLDPLFESYHVHIGTDPSGNDCKDKGLNAVVGVDDVDIDGEVRDGDGQVDIGADEISECTLEKLTLTPGIASGTPNTPITVTAYVYDPVTRGPAADCRVEFTVSSGGQIESISPQGNLNVPPSPAVSGWGISGPDGIVVASVNASAAGSVVVTASVSKCGQQRVASSQLLFGCYSVGFAIDLCENIPNFDGPSLRVCVESYLQSIAARYNTSVVYNRITNLTSIANYNTVIIAMPTRDLVPSEIGALVTFVNSGRHKRIVLVGEHTGYASYDSTLNNIAINLGMSSRFGVTSARYDAVPSTTRLCNVNNGHYLMLGVDKLWDAYCSSFDLPLPTAATPLAYTNQDPSKVWIVEEDTESAGSRILIQDSNVFDPTYGDTNDTVPNKNYRFMFNLCTLFNQ